MYKHENIEEIKDAMATEPTDKDWDNLKERDYRKAFGKQRKKNIHLTPPKKKRKKR